MRQQFAVLMAAVLALSLFAPAVAASPNSGPAATDASQAECTYPVELTDATGETITIEEEPESVVALAPSDVQTVFEIGAEDRLEGMAVEPATDHFEQGDRVDVTDNYAINHEVVVDLEPDVVLAANATVTDDDIETFRDAGLTVYHYDDANTIDDVRENVFVTGELTGECDGATETVDWMDERLDTVETALEDVDRPLAYYAMGDDGTTAGTESFIHEVLTTAGVEDLAERAGITFYQELSSEVIVEEDPEWIIHPDDHEETPIPDAAEATTAYQEDNVVTVDANQISQPAPQVIYALVDIVEAIHPDAFEAASEGLDDASDDAGDGEDSDDDSVPGFGIAGAVAAALVAAGFLARRR